MALGNAPRPPIFRLIVATAAAVLLLSSGLLTGCELSGSNCRGRWMDGTCTTWGPGHKNHIRYWYFNSFYYEQPPVTVSGLKGDEGNNTIIAGYGALTLSGGGGSDTFKYLRLLATGGTIEDFVPGTDRIDLTALHNGKLSAAGNTETVSPESVAWRQAGADTIVTVEITGDTKGDLVVTLKGVPASMLDRGDFLL